MPTPADDARATAPIAVVGMALRVPGATTLARFWQNLITGRDCLTRPSAAALRAAGISQKTLADPDFVRARPILDDVERFDADFFAMSAREAERTDPAQRLFLECAWECLESAGLVPGRNAPVTGVFGGCEGNYLQEVLSRFDDPRCDPSVAIALRIGNSLDFLTTRVSHKLDLTGPSFGVLAACATSLLAIDLAVRSLRRGECEVAVAGGATIDVPRLNGYLAGVEGMLSPSGRLRPFDAGADGTIFGSGVGAVALRPLADAVAAGNPIYAVIRGSASCNDGNPAGKESFIAPSPEGQTVAIEAALRDAGVTPDTIGYVEAHGTGTLLGDPVEAAALTGVYRRHTDRIGYCSLGSVKANVGHLRCAAGVTSLIKACLALSNGVRPPLANLEQPNPRIDFAASPFVVHGDARRWPEEAHPRRAAVSSFGFGGSNVHVVLEEHRPAPVAESSRRTHLLVLSARTPVALQRRIDDLGVHLEEHPALPAADVAHTLQRGRQAFAHRACFLSDGEHVAPAIFRSRRTLATSIAPARVATPVFIFPGQGSQRIGAGRHLYVREALFRDVVDECAQALAPMLKLDVRTLLGYRDATDNPAEARRILRLTANAQPALFVVEYAIARLFMSWGVTPAAMLGHSLGELVAACLAGVFSLADGLKIVAARARLMQDCEPGAMAAVFLPEEVLAPRLPQSIEIAVINTPSVTVVSGPTAAVAEFCATIEQEGVGTQRIETSHAFHSRMMDPALPEFARLLAGIPLAAPRIPLISNATGLPLDARAATDPRYWAGHVRNPVRFSAGVRHLLSLCEPVFVELGPGATLTELIRRHDPAARVFPALGAPDSGADEAVSAHAALGAMWCAGVDVEWKPDVGERRQLLALPTYPFQRLRHWRGVDEGPPPDPAKALYERGFCAAPLPEPPPPESARPWLVLGEERGLGAALRDALERSGATVASLIPGDAFVRLEGRRFRVRPDSREDLESALVASGVAAGATAPRVLHLGLVTGSSGRHNTAAAFESAARKGFYSLLALTKAAYNLGLCDGLEVLAVVDGLVKLDGESGPRFAEKAAVLGACRVVPLEIPSLRMRVADIPCHDSPTVPGWIPEALLREASAADAATLVCLREGSRLVEQLYALPDLPESGPRLREGGVVLITGGTGGLGLAFAGALFDLCRARIVLTARWEPPPEETWSERARGDDRIGRSLAGVLALRARGAEVGIVAADVADAAQVARAVEVTKARFGGLHGVIHAAGALDPTPAIDKAPQSAARVFGPKVHGAFHLESLLADEPLDFVLQISSQASQSPSPGQVDYAAANAVLDALAQNRAERVAGLSCAIGWGAWQDIGLAVRRLRQTLAAGADPAGTLGTGGGRESFEDVLSLDHPILRSRTRRADGALTYRGELRRGHWLVEDHRLEGRPLLSGTTTLQLVLTAFRRHSTEAGAVELTRVAFQRPLFADERGTQIEIGFSAAGNDETFTLRSRPLGSDQDWQVNSTGYVRRSTTTPRPSPVSPPPEAWGDPARRRRFGGRHLSGGPRWQWRRLETEHEGRGWKRVTLPPEFVADLADFDLHPALLDGALSGPAASGSTAEYVPHTYDCVRIFAPLVAEVLAASQRRSLGIADISDTTIVDLEGKVLAEVEGQVWRLLDGSSLVQEAGERAGAGRVQPARPAESRRVVVAELGDLDSLRIEAFTPRMPGPGEVEIEVRAAGLNFKDVLSALGEVPQVGAGPFAPGGECSGVVRAVGQGVRGLAPGDAVVAIARASIGTHVTTVAHAVAAKPANLDFERAAGVPIVFLTAQYALETLARVAPGERVLIHAAAGGVGLAAIQIARLLGAEVFATAGRADKRDYLRSLGVEHVFDSRSLAFVDAVRAATGGEGVDVVLNSLAGEFIPAGLGVLRTGGRFVEIGKRDLQADTALHLAPFLRNLTFTAFDLGRIVDEQHAMLPPMFDSLLDRFARGELHPLPTSVIPFERAEEGFRRMARAEHIGKIVFGIGAEEARDGALARAFVETYGTGVSVEWGLDVFRRILSWSETPPYVLATGMGAEGAGAPDARPRAVAGAGRSRDNLKTAFRAPTTAIEKVLTGLWQKILGIAPIGIDDSFFDLGGDSIEAIQIQHAIHREFDLRLKNTEFLTEPTIAAIARLIAARHAPTNAGPA